jgi:hypothetical protein
MAKGFFSFAGKNLQHALAPGQMTDLSRDQP